MAEQHWRKELGDILTGKLDEGQVRVLCFDMGVSYDSLGGQSKPDKIKTLVEFCERRGILHQLLSTLRAQHPGIAAGVSDPDAPAGKSRVKVELHIESDIISFGNQKRADLIQAIANLFDIEQDEIHVLTEASAGAQVQLLLGMPREGAERILFPSYKDSRFDTLYQEHHVREMHLVKASLGRWQRLSAWKSHRVRGMLRLLIYLVGFMALALMGQELGLALAQSRYPGVNPLVLEVLGALPGIAAWAALLIVLAKFMQTIYIIGNLRQTFEYMFLCVFGPLFTRYPFVFVREGAVDKLQAMPQSNPDGPGGPCLLIIFNDSAVVLEHAGRRTAVVGPSVYTTNRFEKVWQALDLRPQTRTAVASLITRDGIPVKVRAGATFRIRWRDEPTTKLPYPADPDALLQAAASLAVFQIEGGKKELRNWAARVGGNLDVVLRDIVARYRLDELLEPRDPGLRPRSDLERNYTEALRKMAAGFGAEVTEVRLEPFEFDTDLVKRQWVDTWQAAWEGQARLRAAQAEAGAIRVREMAHAYAQLEMIAAITREFQTVAGNKSISADLIVLRFVEVIRRMVANPESAIFMPHEALQTLEGVRKMLREEKTSTPVLKPPASESDTKSTIQAP